MKNIKIHRVHASKLLDLKRFPETMVECRLFLGVPRWAKFMYRDFLGDYLIFTDKPYETN